MKRERCDSPSLRKTIVRKKKTANPNWHDVLKKNSFAPVNPIEKG